MSEASTIWRTQNKCALEAQESWSLNRFSQGRVAKSIQNILAGAGWTCGSSIASTLITDDFSFLFFCLLTGWIWGIFKLWYDVVAPSPCPLMPFYLLVIRSTTEPVWPAVSMTAHVLAKHLHFRWVWPRVHMCTHIYLNLGAPILAYLLISAVTLTTSSCKQRRLTTFSHSKINKYITI